MPAITKTRFFELLFIILELNNIQDPIDKSKVNNNIARVVVGLPRKSISFCISESSIKINPIPSAAKYGTIFTRQSSFFSSLDFRIHPSGMTRNVATITRLQYSSSSKILGRGFSNDKKNGLSSVTGYTFVGYKS